MSLEKVVKAVQWAATRDGKSGADARDALEWLEFNKRLFEPSRILKAERTALLDALKNIAGMARAWMEGTDPYLGDALTAARFEKAAKDAIASIDGAHTDDERDEANHNNDLARTTRMK